MVKVTLQTKLNEMLVSNIPQGTWFTGNISGSIELCLKLPGSAMYRPEQNHDIPIHSAGAFFQVSNFVVVDPTFHISFEFKSMVPFEKIPIGSAFLYDDALYIKVSSKQGLILCDGPDILQFYEEDVLPVDLEIRV